MAELTPGQNSADQSQEWDRRVSAEMEHRARNVRAGASFVLGRIFIRTLRIATGAGFSLVAFWAFNKAIDSLGKPFASLSPLELLGGIAIGVFGGWLIWFAAFVAFGKGKSRIEADAESAIQRRQYVEAYLREKDRDSRQRTQAYESARTVGRYVGRLVRRAKG
jgi:hypothetical protein